MLFHRRDKPSHVVNEKKSGRPFAIRRQRHSRVPRSCHGQHGHAHHTQSQAAEGVECGRQRFSCQSRQGQLQAVIAEAAPLHRDPPDPRHNHRKRSDKSNGPLAEHGQSGQRTDASGADDCELRREDGAAATAAVGQIHLGCQHGDPGGERHKNGIGSGRVRLNANEQTADECQSGHHTSGGIKKACAGSQKRKCREECSQCGWQSGRRFARTKEHEAGCHAPVHEDRFINGQRVVVHRHNPITCGHHRLCDGCKAGLVLVPEWRGRKAQRQAGGCCYEYNGKRMTDSHVGCSERMINGVACSKPVGFAAAGRAEDRSRPVAVCRAFWFETAHRTRRESPVRPAFRVGCR